MTRRRYLFLLLAAMICLGTNRAGCETPGEIRIANRPVAEPAGRAVPRVLNPQPSDNAIVGAIYYQKVDRKLYICTGTLMTETLVLTAGHCGCGLRGSYSVSFSQNARQPDPAHITPVDGAPILFDQQVCRDGVLANGNDLALIRLSRPVRPDSPIGLSQWPGYGFPSELIFDLRDKIVRGLRLTVVGYGYTGAGTIGVRNQGQVSVYSFDCEDSGLVRICSPFAEMVLADQAGTRAPNDTCGGDSGGPVFWMRGGMAWLIGVTSRAAPGVRQNAGLHCGGGGIYTLIGRKDVHAWLRANGVGEIGEPKMMTEELADLLCRRAYPQGNLAILMNCRNQMRNKATE
jgi:hypothetical protein